MTSMAANKLLLAGAGGHCHSVLDSIDRTIYTDIVIIDLPEKVGQYVCDVPIVGTDQDIPELYVQGYRQSIVTIGSVGNPLKRIELYQVLKKVGFSFPSVIDTTAIVSSNCTEIKEGVFIGKGVIINTGVWLGICCIVNSGAIVDHDCKIGNFAHVGPGVNLAGSVTVKENTHMGIGSSVTQSITIGANTIIGAGSVVVRDIAENVIAYGNPCREVKQHE